MRKIFRMKHEPCTGACYAGGDVVDLSFLAHNKAELRRILEKMIRAHDPICGNENLSYAIDLDERTGIFVASFIHYGKLDLFCNRDLLQLLHELFDFAIAHFNSPNGRE